MSSNETIESALRAGARILDEHGNPSSRLDAELLLADTLQTDRVDLVRRRAEPLDDEALTAFHERIHRRRHREPVAYILGRKDFWGREFLVSRHVLIPRPETELLVEVALRRLQMLSDHVQQPLALDLGAGSGAIGVTLAAECPWAAVTCSDISIAALRLALDNAERLVPHNPPYFLESDGFDRIGELFNARYETRFHLIVSNPPYVAERDRDTLEPELLEYEPSLALFAGPDGLDMIRILIEQAPDYLKPGGSVMLEIGHDQAEAVKELISLERQWEGFETFKDGGGYERVVHIWKASE